MFKIVKQATEKVVGLLFHKYVLTITNFYHRPIEVLSITSIRDIEECENNKRPVNKDKLIQPQGIRVKSKTITNDWSLGILVRDDQGNILQTAGFKDSHFYGEQKFQVTINKDGRTLINGKFKECSAEQLIGDRQQIEQFADKSRMYWDGD